MASKEKQVIGYQTNWRQYRFQSSDTLSLGMMEKDFTPFFNPHPLVQTSGRPPKEPLLGVIALWKGEKVGLILVEKLTEQQGLVICWHVLKSQRGFKLGKQLVSHMEKLAVKKGVQHLSLSYRRDSGSQLQITKSLYHLDWQDIEKKLWLTKFSVDRFVQMAWCKKMKPLPAEYEIFLWDRLTEQDKQYIKARQKKENWYPKELPPVFDQNMFDHETSVGLRLNGDVVGWMMTNRINDRIVEYNSLFVSPTLQRLGRGMHLIVDAITRQQALGLEFGIFQVLSDNQAMCGFIEKRMKSTVISQTMRDYLDKSLK